MACATLKRSLDFDPVYSHPTKRQRCSAMVISPSSSPPSTRNEAHSTAFSGVCPKMSSEKVVASIREEIRRLHRQKLLHFNPKLTDCAESSSQSVQSDCSQSSTEFSTGFSSHAFDKPLFSFRQVGLICERLISDRENEIREEYDRYLTMKLSEQYETFVKFSSDQLHRRFDGGSLPSSLLACLNFQRNCFKVRHPLMNKNVFIESKLETYLQETKKKFPYGVIGIVLGQELREASYAIHLSRFDMEDQGADSIFKVEEDKATVAFVNALEMLPGGMTILGLFTVYHQDVFRTDHNSEKMISLLEILKKFMDTNRHYHCNNNLGFSKFVFIQYWDNSLKSCRQFSWVDDQLIQQELPYSFSADIRWLHSTFYYSFESGPLYHTHKTIKSDSMLFQAYLEHLVTRTSLLLKKSTYMINGEMYNESSDNLNVKLGDKISEEDDFITDIFTLSADSVTKPISMYWASGELKYQGTICCDVYINEKATFGEAMSAIREDIIRSLFIRLMLHCNTLPEDTIEEETAIVKVIHEPPRRVSFEAPYTRVRFMDHVFAGEESVSITKAQIDCDEKIIPYESLEGVLKQSEFDEKETVAPKTTTFIRNILLLLNLVIIVIAVLAAFFWKKEISNLLTR